MSASTSARTVKATRPGRRGRVAAVAGLLLAAHAFVAVLAVGLQSSSTVTHWVDLTTETIDGRSGGVLALRAVLATAPVPIFLLLLLVALAVTLRRSMRLAVALALAVTAANVTVQLLKSPPISYHPVLSQIGPLSGQVALVAAVCLGWLVVSPGRTRRWAAWGAFAVVGAFCAATVLTRWHTMTQVLLPLVICWGWATCLVLAMRSRDGGRAEVRRSHPEQAALTSRVLLGTGGAGLVVVSALAMRLRPDESGNSDAAVVLAVAAVVLVAALVVGVTAVVAAAAGWEIPEPERRWRSAVGALVNVLRATEPDGSRVGAVDVGPDLSAVVRAAELHGVEGWLRRATTVPAPGVDSAVHRLQARRLRVLSDLEVTAGALGDLPYLVVKGPALAATCYADQSLRSFVDLDLLVRPADLDSAVSRMVAAGCTVLDANWPLLLEQDGHEIHLTGPTGGPIDLHWSLGNEPMALDTSPSAETLLARSVPIRIEGRVVRTLAPADMVLHVALHAALSGGHRLLALADLRAALTATSSSDSTAQVLAAADEWGARPALSLMLGRLRRTLGFPVDPALRRLVRPGLWRLVVAAADWVSPPQLVGLDASVSRLVARSCREDPRSSLRAVVAKTRAWWAGDRRPPPLARDMLGPEDPASTLHPAGGPGGRQSFFQHVATAATRNRRIP